MRTLFAVLALVAMVAIGLAARRSWIENKRLPEGLLQVNGRMEGDHVVIASKYAGRIMEMRTREGCRISAGQVVVRLDDAQLRAKLNQANHAVAVAKAILRGAEADANVAAAELRAARTSLRLLKKQVPLEIETAAAELKQAMAVSATADSNEGFKRSELDRAQKLLQSKAISQQETDQIELAWTRAHNELTTAGAARTTAEKRLAEARLGTERIAEKVDAIAALEAKQEKERAKIAEAKARQAEAEAALDEAQSMLDDLTITAPSSGTIVTRFVDQGEVVAAGGPIFDLVNLDRLYLQVYVPETQIGRIRLGLSAKVFTDAFPDSPFDATVHYIASEAEFTPKEVQTKDERVKLVYAVRLYLDANPDQRLTPGIPADAIIRWKPDAQWSKPQW